MNDLNFRCPHCKQSLEVPEALFGKEEYCPSCNRKIQIPKPEECSPLQVAPQNVTVEIKRGVNPFGIASLVIGIFTCIFCWIPFVGLLSIPMTIIGFLLGVIGLIMAVVSKKTGFTFPISGSIVCLVSFLIAFSITSKVSETIAKGQRTNQSVISNEISISALPPKTAIAPAPVTAEPAATSTIEEWTNAASTHVRQGDVRVQITSVTVGKVALKNMFGGSRESKDNVLIIKLEVTNLSPRKKINFATWRERSFSFDENFISLSDDNENTYELVGFGASSTPVGGVNYESIYPGKSITDVLVFEVPVDMIKWMHLKLPARNFQGKDMLRFEIPASMIDR